MNKIGVLLLLLTFLQCSQDDSKKDVTRSTSKQLTITTIYQGSSFNLEQNYISPNGYSFRLDNLKAFLSDPITDDKIDTSYFLTIDGEASIQLPSNSSDELIIGLGVDSTTNKTITTDYPISHPLGDADEYWTIWGSYIFLKVEGKIDLDNDGRLEQGFTYHIGMDTFYRELTFPLASEDLQLELSIDSLLFSKIDSLDLSVDNLTHTNPLKEEQIELSGRIVTKFINSLEIVE